MNNLEQFGGEQNNFSRPDSWAIKKSEEDILKLEQDLEETNKEIHEIENSAHSSYFGKVLHGFIGKNKQNKLTLLYQKRHTQEAMIEKMKGGKMVH